VLAKPEHHRARPTAVALPRYGNERTQPGVTDCERRKASRKNGTGAEKRERRQNRQRASEREIRPTLKTGAYAVENRNGECENLAGMLRSEQEPKWEHCSEHVNRGERHIWAEETDAFMREHYADPMTPERETEIAQHSVDKENQRQIEILTAQEIGRVHSVRGNRGRRLKTSGETKI
jgi:hypothetical protein